MKIENEAIFKKQIPRWEIFSAASIIRDFTFAEKKEFLDAVKSEFDSDYQADLDCESCIADMLKYGYHHYNAYVANQKKIAIAPNKNKL
jgi:hypothetical protein